MSNETEPSQLAARDQFHRRASEYATSSAHSSSESLEILKAMASGRSYDRALDIATGPGFTAFAVAELCERVVASDIAPGMLEQAKKIAVERGITNVEYRVLDAHDIPYDDATFDLVTCRTAAHHFRDIPQFLREANRVLTREGVLLLVDTTTSEVPQLAAWHQRVEALRDPTHVGAPSPTEWRRLLGDAGFAIGLETHTQVDLTFRDWVNRSDTPSGTVETLFNDFHTAHKEVVEEYKITAIVEGNDFGFAWPVIVVRAQKATRSRR